MRAQPYLQRFADEVLAWMRASGDPTLNEFLPIAEAANLEKGETRAEGLLQFAREVLAWQENSGDLTINLLLESGRRGIEIADGKDVPSVRAKAVAVKDGPAVVTRISMLGHESREMYDEYPGLEYFKVATGRDFRLSEAHPVRLAIYVAERLWASFRRDSGGGDLDGEEYDGRFLPSKILLRDAAGGVVQQFDGRSWITEFPAPQEWPLLMARASELESEASGEARWDNFCTSEYLREQARDLRNRVAIAQANLGVAAGPENSAVEEPVAPVAAEPKTIGAMVDARPMVGDLLNAYAELDELLDGVVGSLPEGLTEREQQIQSESNEVRDRIQAALALTTELPLRVQPATGPALADASIAILHEPDPRPRAPLDVTRPLYDEAGRVHDLVTSSASQVVTRSYGVFGVWDRKTGECLIAENEGLRLSNEQPSVEWLARRRNAAVDVMSAMHATAAINRVRATAANQSKPGGPTLDI
ncbi:hypothetical protein BOC44_21760 (plasmid) [Burkholderia pseudomallei]|nr:hypothetical protein BOC44_21760 [Burkholderia pseudomallei]